MPGRKAGARSTAAVEGYDMISARSHWLLYGTLAALLAMVTLNTGCPQNQPPADGDTTGGDTTGGDTTGGDTTGGDTTGGDTTGGDTTGGDTTGGDTTGGDTTGGDTTGGDTGGGGGGTGGGDGDGGSASTPPTDPATTITLSQIVQTGDAVPDQPAGTTFTEFSEPIIDDDGRIAFWGLFEGANANGFGGLYVWNGTALQRVVHDDPATLGDVPNHDPQHYFGKYERKTNFEPLDLGIAWGPGGRLLFATRTANAAGGYMGSGVYRWRASDGDLIRVADTEQLKALYSPTPSLYAGDFIMPGVSDSGVAVFGVDYTIIAGTSFVFGQGVFTSNGTTVSVLRDTKISMDNPGDVPDQGAAVMFVNLDPLTTLNPTGDLLFQAHYAGGSGSVGVYLGRSGVAYRVIDDRPDHSWPGLPAGARVSNGAETFTSFAVGPSGHIALDASLTVGGNTEPTVLLWDWDTGAWSELTGAGSVAATDLVSGVNDDGAAVILAGGKPYLADDAGQRLLSANLPTDLEGVSLTWGTNGAVNNHGRAVLPFADGSGLPGLLFWTGTELLTVVDAGNDVPTGDVESIATVVDPRRDRPSRSGLLNDGDQMTFLIDHTGGAQTIYKAIAD